MKERSNVGSEQRWTQERSWTWYGERAVPFGTNFLPSTVANFTELWDRATWDEDVLAREMSVASATGFNSLRVFLPYLVWEADDAGFLERLDRLLAVAHERHMTVIPVLFNEDKDPYLGTQHDPVPGVHGSSSTGSPGPTIADDRERWPRLERYVQAVIGAFAHDDRVLMWDIYNEPGNAGRGAASLPLLQEAFRWARSVGAAQPLTAGAWFGGLAHTGTTEGSPETDRFCLEQSDVITFHDYGTADVLRQSLNDLGALGYPLVCTEWMARTRQSLISTHLPIFAEAKVGCYMWGLVAGRTQTYFPWGSPPGAPEPEIWFHDLYHAPDIPYAREEIALLQNYGHRLRDGG